MIRSLLLILLLLIGNHATAEQTSAVRCHITQPIWSLYPPPPFATTNNLRRKTGSADFAQGHFINIVGRVTDSNCIPITGAVVRIWQANAFGVYENDPSVFDNKDPNFVGSGSITTDNLGNYSFLTVMPAANGKRAPHIKFSVYYPGLKAIETEMFFPDQYLTSKDQVFKSQLNAKNRKFLLAKLLRYDSMSNADIYEFNITLEGKLNYKQH